MQVDLSEAAKAYGLQDVPPVKFDWVGAENCAFDPDDWVIHVDPGFLSPTNAELSEPSEQHRFTDQGLPALDGEDAVRFILAHELWHARQYEMDYDGTREATEEENARMFMHDMLGIGSGAWSHDAMPLESSADEHAAKVYKLVKLF